MFYCRQYLEWRLHENLFVERLVNVSDLDGSLVESSSDTCFRGLALQQLTYIQPISPIVQKKTTFQNVATSFQLCILLKNFHLRIKKIN